MKEFEYKLCPFCGGIATDAEVINRNEDFCWVSCSQCGAIGAVPNLNPRATILLDD